MTCIHLRELFDLCTQHNVKVSSAEVVHFVCNQCNHQETCPAMLADEYDARDADHHDKPKSTISSSK
jgi:hypothetical protein